MDSGEDRELCVGILGMGHLGKQLLQTLLQKTSIKPSQIKISTRRPELAGTLGLIVSSLVYKANVSFCHVSQNPNNQIMTQRHGLWWKMINFEAFLLP